MSGGTYEEAKRLYPRPIWADGEAALRAQDEGTFWAAYEASWIWPPGATRRGGVVKPARQE